MPGSVVQAKSGEDVRRYYLDAPDENSAVESAATLLGTQTNMVTLVRSMAKWEEDLFPPFPNGLVAAP